MLRWAMGRISWTATVLLLLSWCHAVSTSRIIIDPQSCRAPSQRNPDFNLQTVQRILDEAFAMAKVVKDSLAQAAADPTSISGRRVNYILNNMLAVDLGSAYFGDVQRFFDLVLDRQAGSPPDDLNIYCNENFRTKKTFMNSIPLFGRPQTQGYCEQLNANAYAEGGKIIVICQSFWQKYYYEGKQLVANDYKTHDLTGTFMDQLETASGSMLHELLHSASFGEIQSNGRSYSSVVDIAIEFKDQTTPSGPPKKIEGYGFTNCKLIAEASNAAQRLAGDDTSATDQDVLTFITTRTSLTKRGLASTTPGIAYLCADNLRLAALQLYLIKNDFVGTGRARNFNANGFTLPP